MSAYDLVIRHATLYDGTGAPPSRADVGLRSDRIAAIGPIEPDAGPTLDAAGLALAPGFIDVHTHDDLAVVLHPEMGFKTQGGVTTVVVGNCGIAAAPQPGARVMGAAFHPGARVPEWDGVAGYLAHLDAEPASCNVAALAGHGVLRMAVMGGAARPPTVEELRRMRALLREAIEAGAFGLSTGLFYEPGKHAATDEVVALARELRGSGALYATHMRDEGAKLLESVDEAIEIGERAGVPVQISHHKASGRAHWGKVQASLRRIESARARGLDVTADQYPYTAGSTVLAAVLDMLRPDATEPASGDELQIASAPGHPAWEGRTIAELAREMGLEPLDAARRVVEIEGIAATVVIHGMCEDDVQTVMRHPTTMIGSDGIPSLQGKPHPRLYGTFARVLGRYARDLRLFPLEEAVHRMTGFPARKFGLVDRGALRPGASADLVLFDPAAIDDVASYEDPHHPPRGVAHVFVNGTAVVRDGAHTGARPGRALRRS